MSPRPASPATPDAKAPFVPKPTWPTPKKAPARRRSDFTLIALGVTLGLICAVFPWYIFLNPENFGPPAMKFAGAEAELAGDAAMATPLLPRNGEVRIIGIPDFTLDYTPTGALPRRFSEQPQPPAEQPFPGDATPFRVLHVAAGRAMIEDDAGIWVVQRGSTLPDRSRVETIERRGGRWVLVTSDAKVLDAE